jgi:DNA polymerase elongation subunit (family B)
MRNRPPVYGLDIETDTTINGLDPAVASVITVALVGPVCEEVFTGPEDELLAELDERLAELEPGVVATWNGAAFDLPFIADRAALHGLRLGLELQLDPKLGSRHAPLPGHRGAYRARWFGHRHLDAYRVYRGDVGPALRISCSLKSIARFVGLAPLEVDRTRIHDLTNEALHAYAASDARLARILTERRWATASRCVDRLIEVTEPGPDDLPLSLSRAS